MVGLEGVAVGTAEGVGEFRGGVVDVVTEGLDGEVEASVEKDQSSVNGSYKNGSDAIAIALFHHN